MNTLHTIFDWLIAAGLRASLLTLVVFLLQAALRRHLTARMRYALWLPMLIVLLMPVFPQSRWSVGTVFAKPPQPVQITSEPSDFSPSAIPLDQSPPSPAPKPIDWKRLFIMTWFTGASGILLCGSISFIITLRRFKRSRHPVSDELTITLAQIAREVRLRRIPRIWIASAIHSPAVTGFLRPTLLLPAQFDRSFTPAETRLVLKHELMHLKRHDLPLNALLCVLIALHWFNPLLWLAFFKARLDREAACDAQVLQHDSTDRRREYGHALLKLETAFCPRGLSLGFVGIFQRGTALRSRIHSIATQPNPHHIMKTTLSLCIVLLTFLGVTKAAPTDKNAQQVLIEAKFIEVSEEAKALLAPFDTAAASSSVSGMLNDVQFSAFMKKVEGAKGVDMLTEPRVITRSGQEAKIEIGREFAYKDADGKSATKQVGTTLTLLPKVTGEDQIDLDLSPQIVEFEGFLKHANGLKQPIFQERKVTAKVSMTSGQTVTLRFPATSTKQTTEDRSAGRVTSKTENVTKHTLVFVTARLVNPATGKPLDPKPAAEKSPLQAKREPIPAEVQANKIILPKVQFQDATLTEAVEFLRVTSRELDPEKKGLNILIKPGGNPNNRITMQLKDLPAYEALRYCAEIAGHQLSAGENAFILSPLVEK
jgi:beta-lactamase regulating signal transducer with metallopeptidase domain